ncbi:zinc-dependent alcohol dehydrogenase family protein [Cellulomonas sp. H30R-01]|uniref:zinc-dependent alcohol dehydrogenase family protein n=1 Tax=Cellulomonas sp. H30R-01 TaxID=2704467 RepID=UPI00138C73C0|nr:zinc-dependent alcohol dehydrogenase family protein [Cellulomonas sp. H30R-01]QHT55881.1 zinc-dependent alcohol dehydrogenase family protein [Cellulomonas sp. H30R-01]
MKALVFHGPGRIAWEEVPDAHLVEPTDAVVRMEATTICGTDLHILKGDVPAVTDGRVLGHEGVGTIVAVGGGVQRHAVGDRVVVSCISGCGVCTYCRSQNPSHCLAPEGASGIGWVLGHLVDGTQAELVRVPFADTSLHALPASVPDELAVLLSDILPTGFEIGVQYGHVRPGDTVAVVGAGPVGLAAVATCALHGAAQVVAVDRDQHRLDVAKELGATLSVDAGADWKAEIMGVTDGSGVDVAIECVGVPETFTMCTELVRPGGHVANVGVHGRPVELALQDLWIRNITITTGLVNTTTLPMLLRLVAAGKLPVEAFVTHRFALSDVLSAYRTFGSAADTHALKVLMTA